MPARPKPSTSTISAQPPEMPKMCGTVRRNPKVAPDDSSIMLFGPGVIDATMQKDMRASRISGGIVHATPIEACRTRWRSAEIELVGTGVGHALPPAGRVADRRLRLGRLKDEPRTPSMRGILDPAHHPAARRRVGRRGVHPSDGDLAGHLARRLAQHHRGRPRCAGPWNRGQAGRA